MAVKKQKQKRKNRPKPLSPKVKKIIQISVVIFVFILIFFSFYIGKDFFILKNVEIKGNDRVDAYDILALSGLTDKENLFFISKNKIRDNVEKNILLKVANISLKLPHTVSITVEERKAIALLDQKGRIYEITGEGYILREKDIFSYDLPYLTGFEIDPKLKNVQDDYTKHIITTLENLRKNERYAYDILSEINGRGKDIVIYPRGYNVTILTEKYVSEKKLSHLAAILQALKEQDKKASKIDFRFSEAVIQYK